MAGVWKKIVGTIEDWFAFGKNSNVAAGIDGSNNMVFKDEVVTGTKTLTELARYGVTPDLIPDSTVWTIPEDHQMVLHDNITIDGELIVDGQLVVF